MFDTPTQVILSFIHLYDEHFGHFPKDRRDWIVFPQDFVPATNKKYECYIQWTIFGRFKYKHKYYNVARAYPIEHGNITDVIENKSERSRELWNQEKPKKQLTAMELAFQQAKGKEN